MTALQFSLVSPEKVLFEDPVQMVVIPGVNGDIGVLPGHAPLVTLLRPGVVTIYKDKEAKSFIRIFVDGGMAEVGPEKCAALITTGIPLETLDKKALEIEIKNLLEEVEKSITAEERERADRSLAIAQTKLMEVLSSMQ